MNSCDWLFALPFLFAAPLGFLIGRVILVISGEVKR
jgi:hypothetical protein